MAGISNSAVPDDEIYSDAFNRQHELMVKHLDEPCTECDEGHLDYDHMELAEALMWFKCYKCGAMTAVVMEWM